MAHSHLILLPLDRRPVCYDLPRRLAAYAGVILDLPPAILLGELKQPADEAALEKWLEAHLFTKDPSTSQTAIIALDTIAYGGLIPSRVGQETLQQLESRVEAFFQQIQADTRYGFASILRIPSYNNSEEEPEYWAQYGTLLYQYSIACHQHGEAPQALLQEIPQAILDDFVSRRQRNFALNLSHLDRLKQGQLDYLTFCQDDTGPYGLNVQEAQHLAEALRKEGLNQQGHLQTGADEVASCMLARALAQKHPPAIYPIYSSETGQRQVARFDGIPIEAVVEKAILACGAIRAQNKQDADIWLMVHTPEDRQGDHCSHYPAHVTSDQIRFVIAQMSEAFQSKTPFALADVAYANGSDPRLTEALLSRFDNLAYLYGYAGWNTPGNTIGTTVAMAMIRWIAEQLDTFNPDEFSKLLLIRLADDWLYQAEVRQRMRRQPPERMLDEALLNAEMADGLALLKNRLGLETLQAHCRFPCHRTFEVEIDLP